MSQRRDGMIHVEVQHQESTGVTVITIVGVVDTGTTLILDDKLSSLIREKHYKLVLNMADVSYVSSAGWGLFISLLQRTREHDGDIKLAALSHEVKNVFNLLAFSNLISAFRTAEEAVEAFVHE